MGLEMNHFDEHGNAVMVDVSEKAITNRIAVASGKIRVNDEVLYAIINQKAKKGDVLGVARVAGIMGTKQTSNLIPMCHPLLLCKSTIDFNIFEEANVIEAICTVKVSGNTGVEMEALMGVNIALLTIYDMCKAIDRGMEIFDVQLCRKEGGKSGVYLNKRKPTIIAISGIKNSGKTTFIENLIPILKEQGISTAVIKHDGHEFEPDVPGTDSNRIRQAGAQGVAVFCDSHYMVIKNEPVIVDKLVEEFEAVDLIILEGFKYSNYPKIEIVRQGNSTEMVCDIETVLGVATNCDIKFSQNQIGLSDYQEAVKLIKKYMQEAKANAGWV